jgi:UDP-N-acetylglucosamine/UDP-N-acetylgalactosamine diphosphorylase
MPDISHVDPHKQKIIDTTIRAGQGHVFRWWNDIGEDDRSRLLDQLSRIDFDGLRHLFQQYRKTTTPLADREIEPADVIPLPKNKRQFAAAREAFQIGEDALRAGEVAVFMVAGGQATRLGMDAPKGTLQITPIKRKSIFQLHAEKIRALSNRYEARLPFYIMTSETNHLATKEFFRKHSFFGLELDDVFFFAQEMVPALDYSGKLILDSKDHVFTNPNGHGGSISSLYNSGTITDMRKRGIKHIFYFQVDNILIKIADPLFLGYHIREQADMSAKIVPKRNPEEKVGVLCEMGKTLTVIEYSDLPDEHRYAKNTDGSLRFSAGNIAVHLLSVDFVEQLNTKAYSLPFHIAEKIIPYIDDDGNSKRPEAKNGLKFEKFVFDALARAKLTAIMEVTREEEFAPIKNSEGEDSPATARELMIDLHARWLEEAGARLPRDSGRNIEGLLEISPLFALDADELRDKLPDTLELTLPLYLGPE